MREGKGCFDFVASASWSCDGKSWMDCLRLMNGRSGSEDGIVVSRVEFVTLSSVVSISWRETSNLVLAVGERVLMKSCWCGAVSWSVRGRSEILGWVGGTNWSLSFSPGAAM